MFEIIASASPLQLSIYAISLSFFILELFTKFRITVFILRMLALAPSLMDFYITKAMKRILGTRFKLGGQCHMCGRCCHLIVGDPPRFIKNNKPLRKLYSSFHRVFHNFEEYGRGDDNELIFRCKHLGQDHLCSIYYTRPKICRDYPLVPWQEPPKPMKICGYYAADKNGNPIQLESYGEMVVIPIDDDSETSNKT